MSLSLAIPKDELVEFAALPDAVQDDIKLWLRELGALTPPIVRALKGLAGKLGCDLSTAKRKYYAMHDRGWRGLINHSKLLDQRGAFTPEFIEFWRELCHENKRKIAPAYREFTRRYVSGEPIPGLAPGVDRRRLPRGFGYDNLIRFAPTPFETAASRIGRGAAAPFRPKVLTNRLGLHVGERFIFDDMWHDFEVVMLGQRRPMRPLQLHAHDLLSACQFARGLKPRMEDPETGKRLNLTQDEMLFLVAYILSEIGFWPDGCVIMAEHGTAAVPEELEQLLYDLSGGKVTVDRSGIEGVAAFAGQYDGRPKGNFRFKAALESLGNLIHNETANALLLPGQTGFNSRLNCPEELHGREKHFDTLALAILALYEKSPATVAKLKLPFVEWNTAKWVINEVMERINRRTEHNLQNWLDLGFTTVDLDIPGVGLFPSAAYLALPADKRAAVDAVAKPMPRKLSPREVFDAGSKALVKFRPEQTAMLLKGRNARKVHVDPDHCVRFQDQLIASEPIVFLAHHFAPGDEFDGVVNPMDLSKLHIFDAKGRWRGVLDAWQTVSHADTESIHRQMGAAAKIEKELLAPLARRGAQITLQRIADAKENARAAGEATGAIPTPEAKQQQRSDVKLARDHGKAAIDALLGPSIAPAPKPDSTDDFLSIISK